MLVMLVMLRFRGPPHEWLLVMFLKLASSRRSRPFLSRAPHLDDLLVELLDLALVELALALRVSLRAPLLGALTLALALAPARTHARIQS
jgi:hypothetical protein